MSKHTPKSTGLLAASLPLLEAQGKAVDEFHKGLLERLIDSAVDEATAPLLAALEAVEKLLNATPAMMMHDTGVNHVCYPEDDISKALGTLHAALLLARGHR